MQTFVFVYFELFDLLSVNRGFSVITYVFVVLSRIILHKVKQQLRIAEN